MDSNVVAMVNLRRLRNIKRCSTFFTVLPISVDQHSFHTTILSVIIAKECISYNRNVNLLTVYEKSLCHDIEEAYVSDIPYNVKHYSEDFNTSLKELTDCITEPCIKHCSKSIKSLFEANKDCKQGIEREIVQIADMLELAMYCSEEMALGNTTIRALYDNCMTYLKLMFENDPYDIWKSSGTLYSLYTYLQEGLLPKNLGKIMNV